MQRLLTWLEEGATVITASGRQARHLRRHYDRHQARAGKSGWAAANILPMNAWLEQLWEQALLAGSPAGSKVLLGEFEARQLWRRVVAGAELPNAGRSLALVMRSWNLMADWDIRLDALQASAADGDERTFADWAVAYNDRCAGLGAVDQAGLPSALTPDIVAGGVVVDTPAIFVGFWQWTPRLKQLADALTRVGCPYRIYQPVMGDGTASRASYANCEDEMAAVTQWAVDHCRRDPDLIAGILLPETRGIDAGLRRRILDILQPDWRAWPAAELPVAIDTATALADSGPVRAALLALELATGRMRQRDFGQLLRSAWLAGGLQEADARARLELKLRAEFQPVLDLWSLQGQVAEIAPEFGRLLSAALDRARQAPGGGAAADWIRWYHPFLRSLGWPGEPLAGGEDKSWRSAWDRLLDALAGAGDIVGPLSLTGFQVTLQSLAREPLAPADIPAGGVQILAAEDAVGHGFDALWLAGLHSDAWPPDLPVNPLLPLHLQRRAGIPAVTRGGNSSYAQTLSSQLLHAAPQVTVSCADFDGELRLTPSPLLETLAPGTAYTPARPSVQERLLWSAETENLAADPAPPLGPGERVRGGSRLLQLQAGCPARAFFELRLGATELEVPELGISARQRGIVTHAALAALYEQISRQKLAPGSEGALALIPGVVAGALSGRLPARDPLAQVFLKFEAQRLESLLTELLVLDAGRPDFTVQAAERGMQTVLGPLTLRLQPDRIDRLADGRRLVIDYKTGAGFSRTAWLGDRPAEPQLPLYAIAEDVDGIAVIRLHSDGVQLLGVAGDNEGLEGFQDVARLTRNQLRDWSQLTAEWRRTLTQLATEFAAGCCDIDVSKPDLAAGQYAALTRLFELPGDADARGADR